MGAEPQSINYQEALERERDRANKMQSEAYRLRRLLEYYDIDPDIERLAARGFERVGESPTRRRPSDPSPRRRTVGDQTKP